MSLEKTYQMLAEHRKKKEEAANLKKLQNDEISSSSVLKDEKVEISTKSWNWWSNNAANEEDEDPEPSSSSRRYLMVVAYVIGQGVTIWAQFGLVFFIFSLIVLLYLNTGRRKRGELSAYSVFNEQCERLPGQMTAEHFERDMLRQRRDN